jgi:hypothetical protein
VVVLVAAAFAVAAYETIAEHRPCARQTLRKL